MREFIIYALKGRTTPDFSLDNLARIGRMDIVCDVIANTLFISNAIRKDTKIHIALTGPRAPPKLLTFDGATLRGINQPYTLSIAHCIRNALMQGARLNINEEIEVSPGITVVKKAFEPLVREKAQTTQLLYLHPKGTDIRKFSLAENVCFVLGDYIGLPRNTEKLLDRLGAEKISLGPKVVFAAHCPIIVHNELDRHKLQNLKNIEEKN